MVELTTQGANVLLRQERLFLRVHTPLGADKLILTKMRGHEAMSELFEFELEMVSRNHSVSFDHMIGKSVTVEIVYHNNRIRFINGIVAEFRQGFTSIHKPYEITRYYAKIRPTLWMTTLTENCVIFQNKSAHEIIQHILGEHKVTHDFKASSRGKAKREFCVQYNESDFNFVSRLLENEGMFYYFSHENGHHKMVICDEHAHYVPCPHLPHAPWIGPEMRVPYEFGVMECSVGQQMVPQEFSYKDYNYETPSAPLHTKAQSRGAGKHGKMYHYPGHYAKQDAGEALTNLRIEEQEASQHNINGGSTIPFFTPGHTFKLQHHPRQDANREYALLRVEHEVEILEWDDQDPAKGEVAYRNQFFGLPHQVKYRPPMRAHIPKIYGTQTAKVTGKSGEEIWTDKLGRIKVKFHWDLGPHNDDKSSCWIRVSQNWTGKNWGFQFTPRIGHEVVVAFLNGDPDYPLVTGMVYNETNTPPYRPSPATQSTIKTNSSKGGGGYNELRFEDKKDHEEIFIHAQKDMKTWVKHFRETTVEKGHDTFLIKDGPREITLDKGKLSYLLKDGNRSVILDKGNELKHLKKGNQKTEITSGNQEIIVTKGKRTTKVMGGAEEHTNMQGFKHTVTKEYKLKVNGNMSIEVQGQLKIKAMMIQVKAQSMIQAKAAMVQIKASGMMMLKAGGMGAFKSSGMLMLKGSMTMIN